MATRRIARGRGVGSPVPIIILSVMIVGLIVSTIVLGLTVGDLEKKLVQAQEAVAREKNDRKKAEDDFRVYEKVVGFTREGAVRELAALKEDLEQRATLRPAPGEPPADAPKVFDDLKTIAHGYAIRCMLFEKEALRLEGELKVARERGETVARDADAVAETKDKQIALEKAAVSKLREEKAAVERERDEIREKLTAEVEDLKARNTKLTKEVAALAKDVTVLQEQRKKDAEKIKELEYPKVKDRPLFAGALPEPPDGKVLTVDADAKHVMLDLGRKDWVEVGMFFTVYEKGDADTRRSKGQVQIRQVYDEIARAKVIKQDDVDPILPGMMVANPAFKRGTKLVFRLKGRFLEPRIEQLLARYPCTIAEKISMETDYLIIGDARPDESKGEMAWDEDDEVLFAKENKIMIMRERELMAYLGEHN